MTNIVQYLDICCGTLKQLCDPGLTPTQMVIKLSPDHMIQVQQVIYRQGRSITANYVKEPFEAEIVNKGFIKVKRGIYTFSLILDEPLYEGETPNSFILNRKSHPFI